MLTKMYMADALVEFFKKIIKDESADPRRVGGKVAERYKLDMRKVIEETSKAKKVVDEIKRDYGVTEKERIKDTYGLWATLFPYYDFPKCDFSFVPYSFAIGVYVPEDNFPLKDAFGYVAEPSRKELVFATAALDENEGEEWLKLRDLTFFVKEYSPKVNSLMIIMYGNRRRAQKVALKWNRAIEEEAVWHELKHIIDNTIMNPIYGSSYLVYPFREVSAALFSKRYRKKRLVSEKQLFDGILKRDIDHFKAREVDRIEDRYKYLKEMNAPQLILDNERKFLEKKYDILRQMKDFSELFRTVLEKGLSQQTLSFLVSTIPFDQLRRELELIESSISR